MSEADELLKKAGYSDIEKFKNGVTFWDGVEENEYIEFVDYEDIGKTVKASKFEGITMSELKAIYLKCQEMGWLDD